LPSIKKNNEQQLLGQKRAWGTQSVYILKGETYPQTAMVSRRKILSRSRDDLTNDEDYRDYTDHYLDDTWYSKEKLYKDHVEEVLRKWDAIDDEIWAKAIVMERNRRVAKAYARAPVLSINGGTGGFDGYRLGLNGFTNPMRDPKTEEFKELIGQGAKIKMDESGNILIKRLSKSGVFVKDTVDESAVSNELLKLKDGLVDLEKPFRVFDMRKFQQNVNRELRRSNPDRVRLESQCVTAVSFVKNEPELLDSPIWIIIINIVALEMLKAKLPEATRVPLHQMQNMSIDPKRRFPISGSSDEDPYSMTSGNGSSGSSSKLARSQLTNPHIMEGGASNQKNETKGAFLPNKDRDYFIPQNWTATSERKRDRSRDNFLDDDIEVSTLKPRTNNRRRILKKTDDKKKNADDPYYCGFSAKTPKYVQQAIKQQQQQVKEKNNTTSDSGTVQSEREKDSRRTPVKVKGESRGGPKYRDPNVLGPPGGHAAYNAGSQSAPNLAHIPQVQPFWWHSRLYPETSSGYKAAYGGYPSAYFERHLPFTYTPSPNEFSSFQFSSQTGLGSQTPITVAKNGKKRGTANPRQNMFNSPRD